MTALQRQKEMKMEEKRFENYVVLIPAYKPVYEQMVPFVTELLGIYRHVVAVDDGGGEAFADVFAECKRLGCTVLTHEVNRGKGAALRTGIIHVMNELSDAEGIITADCDGQHAVKDIIRVTEAQIEHPECMIIGGRRFDENVPARSMAGNTITRFIYKLATGISIYDTQTGLRGFPKFLFDELAELKGDRYEYEMNMLLKLREWGVHPYEIEIKTIYINENKGSHFNGFKDAVRIGARILLFAAGSAASLVIDQGIFLLCSFLGMKYWWAFCLARVISSAANYLINRKVVFGGKNYKRGATLKYFTLAGAVMLLGMTVMTLVKFDSVLLTWVVKFSYDAVMFFVNYIIQRDFVFKVKDRKIK